MEPQDTYDYLLTMGVDAKKVFETFNKIDERADQIGQNIDLKGLQRLTTEMTNVQKQLTTIITDFNRLGTITGKVAAPINTKGIENAKQQVSSLSDAINKVNQQVGASIESQSKQVEQKFTKSLSDFVKKNKEISSSIPATYKDAFAALSAEVQKTIPKIQEEMRKLVDIWDQQSPEVKGQTPLKSLIPSQQIALDMEDGKKAIFEVTYQYDRLKDEMTAVVKASNDVAKSMKDIPTMKVFGQAVEPVEKVKTSLEETATTIKTRYGEAFQTFNRHINESFPKAEERIKKFADEWAKMSEEQKRQTPLSKIADPDYFVIELEDGKKALYEISYAYDEVNKQVVANVKAHNEFAKSLDEIPNKVKLSGQAMVNNFSNATEVTRKTQSAFMDLAREIKDSVPVMKEQMESYVREWEKVRGIDQESIPLDAMKKTKQFVVDIGNGQKALYEATYTFNRMTGEVSTSVKAVNDFAKAFDGIPGKFDVAKRAGRGVVDTLRNIQTVGLAAQKVFTWLVATTLIYGTIRSFQKYVSMLSEIEEKFITLQKVTSDTGTVERYFETAMVLADAYRMKIQDTLDVMTEFARQGLRGEELLYATQAGLLATQATPLSAEESTKALIAMSKQFNIAAEDLAQTVDKITNVANNFAVEAKDLTEGLSIVGQVASITGATIDDMSAIIATAGTVTKKAGNEIGNAWKVIISRIYGSEQSQREISNLLGLPMVDIVNQPLVELLAQMADRWKTVDESQKNAVASAIVGRRRYADLVAVLENFDLVVDAAATSISSFGAAERAVSLQFDSFKSAVQELKNTAYNLTRTFGDELLNALAGAIDPERIGALITATVAPTVINAFYKIFTKTAFLSKGWLGLVTAAIAGIGFAIVSHLEKVEQLRRHYTRLDNEVDTLTKGYKDLQVQLSKIDSSTKDAAFEQQKLQLALTKTKDRIRELIPFVTKISEIDGKLSFDIDEESYMYAQELLDKLPKEKNIKLLLEFDPDNIKAVQEALSGSLQDLLDQKIKESGFGGLINTITGKTGTSSALLALLQKDFYTQSLKSPMETYREIFRHLYGVSNEGAFYESQLAITEILGKRMEGLTNLIEELDRYEAIYNEILSLPEERRSSAGKEFVSIFDSLDLKNVKREYMLLFEGYRSYIELFQEYTKEIEGMAFSDYIDANFDISNLDFDNAEKLIEALQGENTERSLKQILILSAAIGQATKRIEGLGNELQDVEIPQDDLDALIKSFNIQEQTNVLGDIGEDIEIGVGAINKIYSDVMKTILSLDSFKALEQIKNLQSQFAAYHMVEKSSVVYALDDYFQTFKDLQPLEQVLSTTFGKTSWKGMLARLNLLESTKEESLAPEIIGIYKPFLEDMVAIQELALEYITNELNSLKEIEDATFATTEEAINYLFKTNFGANWEDIAQLAIGQPGVRGDKLVSQLGILVGQVKSAKPEELDIESLYKDIIGNLDMLSSEEFAIVQNMILAGDRSVDWIKKYSDIINKREDTLSEAESVIRRQLDEMKLSMPDTQVRDLRWSGAYSPDKEIEIVTKYISQVSALVAAQTKALGIEDPLIIEKLQDAFDIGAGSSFIERLGDLELQIKENTEQFLSQYQSVLDGVTFPIELAAEMQSDLTKKAAVIRNKTRHVFTTVPEVLKTYVDRLINLIGSRDMVYIENELNDIQTSLKEIDPTSLTEQDLDKLSELMGYVNSWSSTIVDAIYGNVGSTQKELTNTINLLRQNQNEPILEEQYQNLFDAILEMYDNILSNAESMEDNLAIIGKNTLRTTIISTIEQAKKEVEAIAKQGTGADLNKLQSLLDLSSVLQARIDSYNELSASIEAGISMYDKNETIQLIVNGMEEIFERGEKRLAESLTIRVEDIYAIMSSLISGDTAGLAFSEDVSGLIASLNADQRKAVYDRFNREVQKTRFGAQQNIEALLNQTQYGQFTDQITSIENLLGLNRELGGTGLAKLIQTSLDQLYGDIYASIIGVVASVDSDIQSYIDSGFAAEYLPDLTLLKNRLISFLETPITTLEEAKEAAVELEKFTDEFDRISTATASRRTEAQREAERILESIDTIIGSDNESIEVYRRALQEMRTLDITDPFVKSLLSKELAQREKEYNAAIADYFVMNTDNTVSRVIEEIEIYSRAERGQREYDYIDDQVIGLKDNLTSLRETINEALQYGISAPETIRKLDEYISGLDSITKENLLDQGVEILARLDLELKFITDTSREVREEQTRFLGQYEGYFDRFSELSLDTVENIRKYREVYEQARAEIDTSIPFLAEGMRNVEENILSAYEPQLDLIKSLADLHFDYWLMGYGGPEYDKIKEYIKQLEAMPAQATAPGEVFTYLEDILTIRESVDLWTDEFNSLSNEYTKQFRDYQKRFDEVSSMTSIYEQARAAGQLRDELKAQMQILQTKEVSAYSTYAINNLTEMFNSLTEIVDDYGTQFKMDYLGSFKQMVIERTDTSQFRERMIDQSLDWLSTLYGYRQQLTEAMPWGWEDRGGLLSLIDEAVAALRGEITGTDFLEEGDLNNLEAIIAKMKQALVDLSEVQNDFTQRFGLTIEQIGEISLNTAISLQDYNDRLIQLKADISEHYEGQIPQNVLEIIEGLEKSYVNAKTSLIESIKKDAENLALGEYSSILLSLSAVVGDNRLPGAEDAQAMIEGSLTKELKSMFKSNIYQMRTDLISRRRWLTTQPNAGKDIETIDALLSDLASINFAEATDLASLTNVAKRVVVLSSNIKDLLDGYDRIEEEIESNTILQDLQAELETIKGEKDVIVQYQLAQKFKGKLAAASLFASNIIGGIMGDLIAQQINMWLRELTDMTNIDIRDSEIVNIIDMIRQVQTGYPHSQSMVRTTLRDYVLGLSSNVSMINEAASYGIGGTEQVLLGIEEIARLIDQAISDPSSVSLTDLENKIEEVKERIDNIKTFSEDAQRKFSSKYGFAVEELQQRDVSDLTAALDFLNDYVELRDLILSDADYANAPAIQSLLNSLKARVTDSTALSAFNIQENLLWKLKTTQENVLSMTGTSDPQQRYKMVLDILDQLAFIESTAPVGFKTSLTKGLSAPYALANVGSFQDALAFRLANIINEIASPEYLSALAADLFAEEENKTYKDSLSASIRGKLADVKLLYDEIGSLAGEYVVTNFSLQTEEMTNTFYDYISSVKNIYDQMKEVGLIDRGWWDENVAPMLATMEIPDGEVTAEQFVAFYEKIISFITMFEEQGIGEGGYIYQSMLDYISEIENALALEPESTFEANLKRTAQGLLAEKNKIDFVKSMGFNTERLQQLWLEKVLEQANKGVEDYKTLLEEYQEGLGFYEIEDPQYKAALEKAIQELEKIDSFPEMVEKMAEIFSLIAEAGGSLEKLNNEIEKTAAIDELREAIGTGLGGIAGSVSHPAFKGFFNLLSDATKFLDPKITEQQMKEAYSLMAENFINIFTGLFDQDQGWVKGMNIGAQFGQTVGPALTSMIASMGYSNPMISFGTVIVSALAGAIIGSLTDNSESTRDNTEAIRELTRTMKEFKLQTFAMPDAFYMYGINIQRGYSS